MKKLLLALLVLSVSIFAQENKLSKIDMNLKLQNEASKILPYQPENNDLSGSKISPMLSGLIKTAKAAAGDKSFSTKVYSRYNNVLSFKLTDKGMTVPVLIKSSNVSSTSSEVSMFSGKVQTIAGDIISAELPVLEIENLALSSSIKYIDAVYRRDMLLNESHKVIEADKVHAQLNYRGEGVVVGIVDSGIDWRHEDFSDATGVRIKYLWDQSGSGTAPSGFGYGAEYTKAQIDAGNCGEIDDNSGGGHGTHVSATAAGGDFAKAGYTGIAPKSDIIFVKGFRYGPYFYDSDVINGCSYIFGKAQAMQKPAVINLSLGGHFSPHDGTSLYEQALSNLTGTGKIIVAAAGNEGSDQIHLSYTASGSDIGTANQTFMIAHDGADQLLIDMWYPSGSISVGLAAYSKSNGSFIGATNPVAPGQVLNDLAFNVNGTVYAYFSIDARNTADANNGDRQVIAQIDSKNGAYDLTTVYWALYTYGSGTFDAWLATGGYFTTDNGTSVKPGDNNKSLGAPSTAQKLISVGSFATKKCWTDNASNQWCINDIVLGDRSSFSSIGPTRDGRLKPEISAPGQMIAAALSSNLDIGVGVRSEFILEGGKHQLMNGTSMASPHVTGTVALMLQKNPGLSVADVLSILESTATKDAYTGTSENYLFGYGKLNAYNAVNATSGGGATQTTLIEEHFDGSTFPPANWTQTIVNAANTWKQGNPQDHPFGDIDGTNIYSALCPWVAEDQNELLISPAFSLGDGDAYVEFYAGHSTNWLSSATVKLHISTDSGNNWGQLWEAQNDGQPWSWRYTNVSLNSYKNKQNLKIAWQYIGNDGDLVGIDNVKIMGYPLTDVEDETGIVKNYKLEQNYPNPFNPTTVLNYQIPSAGKVSLKVFDVLGREVQTLVNEIKSPGRYSVEFNASKLASGIYIYRLQAGEFTESRKMMLLK